jgi:hypothetical protein
MTTGPRSGSGFLWSRLALCSSLLISASCGAASEADVAAPAAPGAPGHAAPARDTSARPAPAAEAAPPAEAAQVGAAAPAVPAEPSLGVADQGIWSDLDDKIQLRLPADLTPERVSARVDERRALLVLAIDGFPRKVYPLGGPATLAVLQVGPHALALRPGDRAELASLLTPERIAPGPARMRDADADGIPDPLDVLIGAKKTVQNADAYTEGYISMKYPMGDVPRGVGVCTDVIIRAVRNAGVDLQRALYEDILRARAAYPMIRSISAAWGRSCPTSGGTGSATPRRSMIRKIRSAPATCCSWTRSPRAPAPITSGSCPIRWGPRACRW